MIETKQETVMELTYPAWRPAIFGLLSLLVSALGFGLGLAKILGVLGLQASNSPDSGLLFWLKTTFQLLAGPVGLVMAIQFLALARRGTKVALSPSGLTVSHLNNGCQIPWSRISNVESNRRVIAFEAKGISSAFPHQRSIDLRAREASPATIEMLFLSYWRQAHAFEPVHEG